MEVVIDGIVYIPKVEDAKVEPIIVEKNYKFELHPKKLGKMNWEDAIKAVKELGDDWRLPTIEECFIMYNNKVITAEAYWGSTGFASFSELYVFFSNGNANGYSKYSTYYVRAVQSI